MTERVLLVGLELPINRFDFEEVLEEVSNLAKTSGVEVTGEFLQKRASYDPAFCIGKGKLTELKEKCTAEEIDCVIFANDLRPVWKRNIEETLQIKVIDRTELILDVFAARALTKQGKLQVELAQLKYLLPRLAGSRTYLSRLGGGIGTRGPGETKLEVDRRRIRQRISRLEKEIEKISTQRTTLRSNPHSRKFPQVSLIGYTNVGKSSLLNALTGSKVLVEDMLFATLDPLTRSLRLPDAAQILITDTVGFIRNLPPDLFKAFRTTLDELYLADLLLNVIDLSSANMNSQMEAVAKILKEMHLEKVPLLNVYNKADLLTDRSVIQKIEGEDSVVISVKTKEGLDNLLGAVSRKLIKENLPATHS